MMSMTESDECTICHKPKSAHVVGQIIHSFSPFGRPTQLFERTDSVEPLPAAPSQPRMEVKLPSSSDPVLRLVLLRLGLITVENIEEVERELRATGVAGHEPSKTVG